MKASTYYREMADFVSLVEEKKQHCNEMVEEYQASFENDRKATYYLEWIDEQKDRYEALDKIYKKLVDKG